MTREDRITYLVVWLAILLVVVVVYALEGLLGLLALTSPLVAGHFLVRAATTR